MITLDNIEATLSGTNVISDAGLRRVKMLKGIIASSQLYVLESEMSDDYTANFIAMFGQEAYDKDKEIALFLQGFIDKLTLDGVI